MPLTLGARFRAAGLPGTGLSYTQVSTPHQTAADAPGEAQPLAVPDVLPKGRAWCGWPRIVPLMAIVAIFVRSRHA